MPEHTMTVSGGDVTYICRFKNQNQTICEKCDITPEMNVGYPIRIWSNRYSNDREMHCTIVFSS